MEKVYATTDDDGHWYVIPFAMKDEFISDLEGLGDENYEEWEDKYSQYLTGGDLNNVQLWAELIAKQEFKYCIEVKRESRDDDYILHETFDREMTRDDIIEFLNDNEHPFLPDYERMTFYKV